MSSTDTPATAAPPARQSTSIFVVLCLSVVLLWSVAMAVVLVSPTARLRVKLLVETHLAGGSPAEPGSAEETAEQRLARRQSELDAAEAELAAREAAVAEREAAVAAQELALDTRASEVQIETEALLAKKADLERLSRLCRQMRPRDAADLLTEFDDLEVLAILRGISDADAAKILAAMPPDRAAEIMRLLTPPPPSPGSTT